MIQVQVESIKKRKTKGSDHKKKSPAIKNKKNQENQNPYIISNQKTKKAGKKKHNLSKNIGKN